MAQHGVVSVCCAQDSDPISKFRFPSNVSMLFKMFSMYNIWVSFNLVVIVQALTNGATTIEGNT